MKLLLFIIRLANPPQPVLLQQQLYLFHFLLQRLSKCQVSVHDSYQWSNLLKVWGGRIKLLHHFKMKVKRIGKRWWNIENGNNARSRMLMAWARMMQWISWDKFTCSFQSHYIQFHVMSYYIILSYPISSDSISFHPKSSIFSDEFLSLHCFEKD